jgi:SEC-C motif-containing protein
MRSRYSAFARGEVEYLLRTQPSGEPEAARRRALRDTCRQVRWQRLEILATDAGGPNDLVGTVTFHAHYRQGGRSGVLQERSRFGRRGDRLDGDWLYLEALDLADGAAVAGVSG